MDINGKKVLVTGAAGFIASHLVEELVEKGAEVTAFIRYNSKGDLGNLAKIKKEAFNKIKICRGDLKNIDFVKEIMKNQEIVFHLAAQISIPHSYNDPREFLETNVLGTFNILQAARELGTGKVIITSTSEVYGTAIYSPIDENHPLQAQSPYSASKIAAEKIAESFYKSFGVPVVIVRPFNTYGPRQSTRAVIPTIAYQALFSDKIRLGDLETKRDFNFVKDTVRGFIKVAEAENSIGEVINIGSGKTYSIREVVRMVGEILGKNTEELVEFDRTKIRPEKSEVRLLLCDNTKAKNLIGWAPQYSLEQGLREVLEYVKQNKTEHDIMGEWK
ncbi:SDR family NAD(P)-dependent oxidoreductase [Candidatus Pacearchaeota archaeon]|nr:SDR family NAD(P)-dependent oxidoreductase [Candidatus Pacearchaeota archaeon]